jgi:hypothetical protein
MPRKSTNRLNRTCLGTNRPLLPLTVSERSHCIAATVARRCRAFEPWGLAATLRATSTSTCRRTRVSAGSDRRSPGNLGGLELFVASQDGSEICPFEGRASRRRRDPLRQAVVADGGLRHRRRPEPDPEHARAGRVHVRSRTDDTIEAERLGSILATMPQSDREAARLAASKREALPHDETEARELTEALETGPCTSPGLGQRRGAPSLCSSRSHDRRSQCRPA